MRRRKIDWDAVNARRGERYGYVGRENERWVEGILRNQPWLQEVVRHEPHSREDAAGKDFTVGAVREGRLERRSFGISISPSSVREAKLLHPDVPQFHFPIGVKPETVVRQVKRLFE